MARYTVIDNTRMIEHRRCEGATGYVTDIAILICYHVRRIGLGILADCNNTIVAGLTAGSRNLRTAVVDKCVGKICRVMT